MRIKRIIAATLAVLTMIFVNISPSIIYADESEGKYHFDVNVFYNGVAYWTGVSVCTFDIYINGKLEAHDTSDYSFSLSPGDTYEVKNIKVDSSLNYMGTFYNIPLSGVVTDNEVIINLVIDCKPKICIFHRNFNESDNVTAQQYFDWCDTQTFMDNNWIRTGYTLMGWHEDSNSKKPRYTSNFHNDYAAFVRNPKGINIYAVWQPNIYDVVINPNGGAIEKDDSTDMTKNDDGSISLSPTYDSNDFSSVNISPSRTGYTFDGIYDADTDGNQVWDSNGAFVEGKYWDKNGNWIYDGNVTLYCHWKAINYTMTFDYNKNGELTNADIDSKTVTYDSPYGELPNPGCAGWAFKEWNTKADGSGSTITKDDICKGDISVYALWSYKPVNVSVPQTLIGDKNGNSEFVVKSDDIESGSIDVTIPDGFYYNQEGKSPVYASISTDGDSKLTKDNTAIKYSIITDGLTAGCWSGSFNINLKLNK